MTPTAINLRSIAKRERSKGNIELAGVMECAADEIERLRSQLQQDEEIYMRAINEVREQLRSFGHVVTSLRRMTVNDLSDANIRRPK